jgi:hypothetical protein
LRRLIGALAAQGNVVNPKSFRDKIITGIAIKYVWDGCLHYALISVCDSNGNEQTYKLDGLLEFSVYDDFGTLNVSQVKMLNIGEQVYLSLDPFDELSEIADYDKDNIWFQFSNITLCS